MSDESSAEPSVAAPSDQAGDDMHIHKPKAPHGLREFVSEIGVIVVGILIALSLESAIEWMHWRSEVGEGRERLREEIAFDEKVYLHRADVAACVQRNLDAVKAVISDLRAKKHVEPISEFTSPQNGPSSHEVWNSLGASQVLVHFPKDELNKYSQFYQNITDIEYFFDRESRTWRQLHLLEGDPNQLSREEVDNVRLSEGDADEMSRLAALMSRRQVEVGQALHIDMPKVNAAWRPECAPIARR
jgi:hypothetical protein